MTERSCPQEQATLAAVSEADVSASLKEHIEGCGVCTEVWSIAQVFAESKLPMPARSLPSADSVYWQAMAKQALEAPRRREQEELRAIARFHLSVGWGVLVAAAVLLCLQILSGVDWLPPAVGAPVVAALATVGSYAVARSNPVPSLFES